MYFSKLQTKGQSLAEQVSKQVAKDTVAFTKLVDLHRYLVEYSEDEDIKYWVACSYSSITSSRTLSTHF